MIFEHYQHLRRLCSAVAIVLPEAHYFGVEFRLKPISLVDRCSQVVNDQGAETCGAGFLSPDVEPARLSPRTYWLRLGSDGAKNLRFPGDFATYHKNYCSNHVEDVGNDKLSETGEEGLLEQPNRDRNGEGSYGREMNHQMNPVSQRGRGRGMEAQYDKAKKGR